MRPRAEVQVVLVAQMSAEREPPRAVGPGRSVAAAEDAAAVVEEAARSRAPWRARRRGDADELLDERRYSPTSDRMRAAMSSTPGRISSSSVGL